MIVKAPGVIKLLGEHAVVYGRLSLAIGINLYAKASFRETKEVSLTIDVPDLGAKGVFTKNDLSSIYDSYKSRKSISDYVSKNNGVLLPFETIAARLLMEFGIDPTGASVELSSEIPIQKGLSSSAALSTALAVGLVRRSGVRLSDKDIIEVARDGDRIIHRNENAGRIDVSTSYYGGYTTFSSEQGAKKEEMNTELRLLIIDTGPKKTTAETVEHVAELYKNDKEGMVSIFDQIHESSMKGVEAIKKADITLLGNLMYNNHQLLQKLGVSSEGLDRTVRIAKEENAHGAKLSGGGGGGIAIVLFGKNKERLISRLKEEGFNVLETKISVGGAKIYL